MRPNSDDENFPSAVDTEMRRHIHEGMRRSDVSDYLGKPLAIRTEGAREIWTYAAHPPPKQNCFDAGETLLVAFVDERVREFGTAESLMTEPGFEFIRELEERDGCR